MTRPHFSVLLSVFAGLLVSRGTARADTITMAAFSGSETVLDFSDGSFRGPSVVYHGVTIASNTSGNVDVSNQTDWSGYFANIPGASQGHALNDFVGQTDLTFDFSSPVNRVGLLLSTSPVTTFTVTAYDDALAPLGSTTVTMPGVAQAVFAGLQFSSDIKRLEVTEASDNFNVTLVDDLRFEAVPLPSAARGCLALLAGVGAVKLFRRKRAALA